MKFDITELLQEWDFTPGQVVARRFMGQDGKEKLQLRVDLGVLQMNAEGRPDGRRPMGHDTWFDFFQARVEQTKEENEGSDELFTLGQTECSKLQQEAIQFHHRYICFFQLEDYASVERDTSRNLEVFEFVDEFAETDELAWTILQFTPQLLMMRTRGRGMAALRDKKTEEAAALIEEGIELLEDFYRGSGRENLAEDSGEISSLRHWLEETMGKTPSTETSGDEVDVAHDTKPVPSVETQIANANSELETLKVALAEAIRREDYEKAADVRDQLRKIQASES